MATRKRTKKQTLAEFRAWLSGVEELQPDDWAPTAEQWKLIRGKIDSITEPKVPAPAPTPAPANQNFNVQPVRGNPYEMTSAQAQPAYIPPPTVSGVPHGQVVESQPPTVPQQAVTLQPAPEIDIAGAAKPNLDTSDGNYNSGFS